MKIFKKHKKYFLSVLISGAMVSGCLSSDISAQSEIISGDIDSDGQVNIIDFTSLKDIVCSKISQFPLQADIDNDGTVNINDIIIMQEYMLGIRKSLPEKKVAPVENKVLTATVSDDMCIRADGKPDDVNILNVAGYNAATPRKVFLKFSAKDLDLSDVNKAEVELKLVKNANGNCEIKMYSCASQWSESSPPAYDSTPALYELCDIVVTHHPSDAGKIIKFDVTDIVRDNPGASEFNFAMLCDHENDSDALSNLALFYSKDSTDAETMAPELVITKGYNPSVSDSISADNNIVRLESSPNAGSFVYVSKGSLASGRNISPLSDAKFNEKTGFCGNSTVCLESISKPGWYICRKTGSSEVILAQDDGSEKFRKNATFIKTKGLKTGTSYRMYNDSERYLIYYGSSFFISSAQTDVKKQSASFLIRSQSNVILDDEFDGNDLNTDVWAYSYPWSDHHNYSAVVRQSQVAVRDGKLVLTATRVADDNWIKDKAGETGYTDNIGEKKWRKYSHITGVVHLPFSRYPLNGNLYMEGRFRMPDKSGFWPAFWLNGNNSWPPEIDIFEYLSNTPEKIYVGIHRQDSSKSNGDGGAGWWITRTTSFFQKEFHTYALDWSDTYINYYIDDVLVKSIEDKAYINNQKNMYLIINLGVGGWAEEPKDSTGENTTFECDYVCIYGY